MDGSCFVGGFAFSCGWFMRMYDVVGLLLFGWADVLLVGLWVAWVVVRFGVLRLVCRLLVATWF